jgi:hypothetical protein
MPEEVDDPCAEPLRQQLFGMPKAKKAFWIRTCQYIDGWTDALKVVRFRLPSAAP